MNKKREWYPSPIRRLAEEEVREICSNPTKDFYNEVTETHPVSPAIFNISDKGKKTFCNNVMKENQQNVEVPKVNFHGQEVMPAICLLDENAEKQVSKVVSTYSQDTVKEPASPDNTKEVAAVTAVLPSEICKGTDLQGLDYGNVILRVIADYRYFDRNGDEDENTDNEVEIQVYLKPSGTLMGTMKISYRQIQFVVKLVKNKYPVARFLKEAIRDGLPEDDIRSQLNGTRMVCCYMWAGWGIIEGRYVYLFKDCPLKANVYTRLNLPFYQRWGAAELANVWKIASNLYQDKDIAIILLLFAFSGVTFKLFELAEHPLEFLLFITGKTGSMKTSIAKVLYMQLVRDDKRERPRRIDLDTGTSFERSLAEAGYDTTMLFDDYTPPKTAGEKKILQDNFERVARMVGDRSTRSRSNRKLEDCQGEGVHGSVVITGEVMGDGLSSNLRCLYCNIERDKVNTNALTWLQDNKYAITTVIKFFTDYAGANWNSILEMIRHQYPAVRQRIQNLEVFSHFRTNEKYAYFMTLAQIVRDFLQWYNCVDVEVLSFFNNLEERIIRVLSMSEASIEDYDPVKTYIRAFIELMSIGQIKIAQKKFGFRELNSFDGFEDSEFIYILESKVYTKVRENLTNSLSPFYLGAREIKTMLAEEGYAVSCPNGKGKKTFSARINIEGSEKKIDFIKLRKKKICELLEEKDSSSIL